MRVRERQKPRLESNFKAKEIADGVPGRETHLFTLFVLRSSPHKMPRIFNGNSLRLPKIAGNLKLTAGQINGLASKSPWTKNFRHMLPVDIKHLRMTAQMSQILTPKVVLTRNRIKYWNIVPGDQIRLRGDRNNTLHTVEAINRWTNRVHLTPTEGSMEVRFLCMEGLLIAHRLEGRPRGQKQRPACALFEMPALYRRLCVPAD